MRRVTKHIVGFLIWCAILVKLQNESYKQGYQQGYSIGQLRGVIRAGKAFTEHKAHKEADRKFWDRVRWS